MSHWRDYVDGTVAMLAAFVAIYYRVPIEKRKAFEASYPRVAALIGMVAAIVPFLPMALSEAKRLVTGPQSVASNDVPSAPWSENASNAPVDTTRDSSVP